jgi:two-component sensor histidine kinase
MQHRSPIRLAEPQFTPVAALPQAADPPEALALRQLRHQTDNTWQRMLNEVALLAGTAASPEARRIGQAIERRIAAAAALGDALFGFTAAPGPMRERLELLCRQVLAAQGDARQSVALSVDAVEIPAGLRQTVLRVAVEMLGNAVKHGLHARLSGRIEVALTVAAGQVTLAVRDDGWGPPARLVAGEGLSLMRELAAAREGEVTLERLAGVTEARLTLPCR